MSHGFRRTPTCCFVPLLASPAILPRMRARACKKLKMYQSKTHWLQLQAVLAACLVSTESQSLTVMSAILLLSDQLEAVTVCGAGREALS